MTHHKKLTFIYTLQIYAVYKVILTNENYKPTTQTSYETYLSYTYANLLKDDVKNNI